jgi:hypothetical protein
MNMFNMISSASNFYLNKTNMYVEFLNTFVCANK